MGIKFVEKYTMVLALKGVLVALPDEGSSSYKKAVLRPFLDDFLISMSETFEIILYSDMNDRRCQYIAK